MSGDVGLELARLTRRLLLVFLSLPVSAIGPSTVGAGAQEGPIIEGMPMDSAVAHVVSEPPRLSDETVVRAVPEETEATRWRSIWTGGVWRKTDGASRVRVRGRREDCRGGGGGDEVMPPALPSAVGSGKASLNILP